MLAESMDAYSNARIGYVAGIPALDKTWRRPDANRAYSDKSIRYLSSGFISEEEQERELLRNSLRTEYERRGFLLSERMVDSTVSKIRNLINVPFRHLEYNYHKESGEYFVKIIDDETDEVIREIPPEKILDIFACLKEIVGLLFDERR